MSTTKMLAPKRLVRRLAWSLYGWLAWDSTSEPWLADHVQEFADLVHGIGLPDGAEILDAGCGTGNHAIALALRDYTVTGIDNAQGMLARARQKAERLGLKNLCLDRLSLDEPLPYADGTFDVVLNISVLQTVREPTFTLSELRRVLKPAGQLALLHAPRPYYHDLPLGEALEAKASHLGRTRFWQKVLLTPKLLAERRGYSQYWTSDELACMLERAGFRIRAVDGGPPIIIRALAVAERQIL